MLRCTWLTSEVGRGVRLLLQHSLGRVRNGLLARLRLFPAMEDPGKNILQWLLFDKPVLVITVFLCSSILCTLFNTTILVTNTDKPGNSVLGKYSCRYEEWLEYWLTYVVLLQPLVTLHKQQPRKPRTQQNITVLAVPVKIVEVALGLCLEALQHVLGRVLTCPDRRSSPRPASGSSPARSRPSTCPWASCTAAAWRPWPAPWGSDAPSLLWSSPSRLSAGAGDPPRRSRALQQTSVIYVAT